MNFVVRLLLSLPIGAWLFGLIAGSARVEGDTLIIHGRGGLRGGNASVLGDHRLAMAAAIAACACRESVTVDDSRCVEKSYPRFWEDFRQLKGEEL